MGVQLPVDQHFPSPHSSDCIPRSASVTGFGVQIHTYIKEQSGGRGRAGLSFRHWRHFAVAVGLRHGEELASLRTPPPDAQGSSGEEEKAFRRKGSWRGVQLKACVLP